MPPATAQALAKGRAYRRAHVVFGQEGVAAWRNDEELFDAHLFPTVPALFEESD